MPGRAHLFFHDYGATYLVTPTTLPGAQWSAGASPNTRKRRPVDLIQTRTPWSVRILSEIPRDGSVLSGLVLVAVVAVMKEQVDR
jgi:hypothetical protein